MRRRGDRELVGTAAMCAIIWLPSRCILPGRPDVRSEGQVCRLELLLEKGWRGEARLPLADEAVSSFTVTDAHKPIEANMAAAIGAMDRIVRSPAANSRGDCGERQPTRSCAKTASLSGPNGADDEPRDDARVPVTVSCAGS